MNVYVTGALWVLGVAAAAAAVTFLVHRFTRNSRNADEAVTGVFTIVAGLQAVLLAFVLISLFDAVSSVRDGSHTEANGLTAVYWASDSLPAPAREQLQDLSRSYVHTVVEQEWPSMREGEAVGGPGWDLLERMRSTIDGAATRTDWQQDRKAEAAGQLWGVYEARQARLTAAGNAGISTVVWLALVVGSILSVALPYLFDVPKLLTHALIVGTLAGTIALLMFAIYQLQNPFSGGAQVAPDAFSSAVDRMVVRTGT
ncbi:Protein of unknown function [Amycolatopsis marina]|uniref:DUF4239 domain-containing protein n=1 Tax=Amycolatopsis marina TaxID=490629 RepID=A0A1I1B031_9PSEU|nr:DUF4239 domain-containing protein [Amycolatopsis marina]SFB43719.1 Protein of unknown function [Amycolatopsis marina]